MHNHVNMLKKKTLNYILEKDIMVYEYYLNKAVIETMEQKPNM